MSETIQGIAVFAWAGAIMGAGLAAIIDFRQRFELWKFYLMAVALIGFLFQAGLVSTLYFLPYPAAPAISKTIAGFAAVLGICGSGSFGKWFWPNLRAKRRQRHAE